VKGIIELTSGSYWQPLLDSPCAEALRPRSCLYVGAHVGGGMSFLPELDFAGYNVTIVEAFPSNAEKIQAEFPGRYQVILSDVRAFVPSAKYDLVIWWHGPEHVTVDEADKALATLDAASTQWTIVGCPFGNYTQGAIYGNEYERHVTATMPEFFSSRGYEVQALGNVDNCGIIIAWKNKGVTRG